MQEALRESGLDGWLFFDHHRRDPLAYRILQLPQDSNPTRRWYYFIPAHGEPRGLVHRIERESLHKLPGTRLLYSRWSEQVAELRSLLGNARRVAMQYSPNCAIPYISNVDAGTIELIRGLGVDVLSSADLVQSFEAVWSAAQQEAHRRAGTLVDGIRAAAFDEIGRCLRADRRVDEWAISAFIRSAFDRAGLVTDHGPIVAVNEHAADPHYEPEASGSSSIKRDDLVLIDLWAKLNVQDAVYYDITWTGFCGAPVPDRIQSVFGTVAEARDAAVARVRTAVGGGTPIRGFEVDDAAREVIEAAGYGDGFVHRTGHSIGTEVHGAGANMDNLESHDERRIIPGTCFSVEPGIYLDDFGIRSEVNVLVADRGADVTGEVQQTLVIVPC